MTDDHEAFSKLYPGSMSHVWFGDGSTIWIQGRHTVLFVAREGHYRILTFVYFILRLRMNSSL